MKRAKHILPALLLLAANYYLMPLSVQDSDSAMIILLLLMPGLTLAVCFACGCGRFSWLFPFSLRPLVRAVHPPLFHHGRLWHDHRLCADLVHRLCRRKRHAPADPPGTIPHLGTVVYLLFSSAIL